MIGWKRRCGFGRLTIRVADGCLFASEATIGAVGPGGIEATLSISPEGDAGRGGWNNAGTVGGGAFAFAHGR